jgi:hypothetical protein
LSHDQPFRRREREATLEKTPRPPNEILELEKKQATELAEVKFSQYFQQIFAEPLDKTRCVINKGKEQVSPRQYQN